MAFKPPKSKGTVKFKSGIAKTASGKPINSLADAMAKEAECGCFGAGDCPCCHYVLGALDGDLDNRLYIWNDAGVFTTGDYDTFKAACDAAKEAK